MSKPKARAHSKNSKVARAAVEKGAPQPENVSADPAEVKKKVAFLNKILSKKPTPTDPNVLKRLRDEVAAQNALQKELLSAQQRANQIQGQILTSNGRVNAVADMLWEMNKDGEV